MVFIELFFCEQSEDNKTLMNVTCMNSAAICAIKCSYCE